MTTFPDRMGSDGISGGVGDPSGPGSCADASSPTVSPLRAAIPIATLWGQIVDAMALARCQRTCGYDHAAEGSRVPQKCTDGKCEYWPLYRDETACVLHIALAEASHITDVAHRRALGLSDCLADVGEICFRKLRAQGIEARRAETQRGSVVDESPTSQSEDAP